MSLSSPQRHPGESATSNDPEQEDVVFRLCLFLHVDSVSVRYMGMGGILMEPSIKCDASSLRHPQIESNASPPLGFSWEFLALAVELPESKQLPLRLLFRNVLLVSRGAGLQTQNKSAAPVTCWL